MKILTDFPERFHERSSFHFYHPQRMPLRPVMQVLSARRNNKSLILRLEGICDRTSALALTGTLIQIRGEDRRPLPEGSYYLFQVEGLEVFDREGKRLGVVEEIIQNPANDVYLVRDDRDTRLIPALKKVVLEVDIPGNRMIVDTEMLEG